VARILPGGVDAVIGTAVLGAPAYRALRGGGKFVSVHAASSPVPLRGTNVVTVFIHGDDPRPADLVSLVDKGELTLRVADTFPLDRAADAHRRFEAGGVRGRLVLEP
jgi:NADPH:quinone reductase-like Zn-dependent oxidoreductase